MASVPAFSLLGDVGATLRDRVDRALAPARRMSARDQIADGRTAEEMDAEFRAEYEPFWLDRRRTLLTPFLAGAAATLWELAPERFPAHYVAHHALVDLLVPGEAEFAPVDLGAIVEFMMSGYHVLIVQVPEAEALAALELAPGRSFAARLSALAGWLRTTELPAPWVAAHLPAAVAVLRDHARPLVRGLRPFQEVMGRFVELAERQGIRTWPEALAASRAYWRETRSRAYLRGVVSRPPAAAVPAPAPAVRLVAGTGGELKRMEQELARAAEELALARAEAEARLARVAAAQREAAEARQARDRAAERVRVLEAENASLRVELPTVRAMVRRSRLLEEAERLADAVDAVEPAGLAPAPAPSFWEVFVGRRIYLYTGRPRAGAREAMRRALERHGATCEVFDGNRVGNLGPERFPADALVVIDTSQLAHKASLLVEARARASGAWVFLGATGVGGLARRVAERWWRSRGVTGGGPTQ